jgi:hypothetical protein
MMLVKTFGRIGCLVGLTAVLATACMTPATSAAPATPADVVFVIPPGAEADMERGDPSFAFPDEIVLHAGQPVVITNHDYAMHYFFDIPISPGQTVQKVFLSPGTFVYQGGLSCSMSEAPSAVYVRVE